MPVIKQIAFHYLHLTVTLSFNTREHFNSNIVIA